MADTATATASPSPTALTNDAVLKRIEKLERNVKKLKRQLRLVPSAEFADLELTPEIRKLIDERLKEADENPGNTIPWNEVRDELQQRFGIK